MYNMKQRIHEKITEISSFLSELQEIVPPQYNTYLQSLMVKAACERYFKKIIIAMIDLSFMIIKYKKLRIPEDDNSAFESLAEEGIISGELALKLRKAKGMRNIMAHEYGEVDVKLVFQAVSSEIFFDTEEFLKAIKSVL